MSSRPEILRETEQILAERVAGKIRMIIRYDEDRSLGYDANERNGNCVDKDTTIRPKFLAQPRQGDASQYHLS
jgi:hypothetical protein